MFWKIQEICSKMGTRIFKFEGKLSALRFCYFLGFQSTYRRTSGHFSIAQDFKTHLTFLPMWKIDLVTEQNVRQTEFWKYHFDGRFCFFLRGLPTLGSIISDNSPSILKILVPILLQISWIFQNTPNILNFDDTEGSYGNFFKN